jgi:hypothetical protein
VQINEQCPCCVNIPQLLQSVLLNKARAIRIASTSTLSSGRGYVTSRHLTAICSRLAFTHFVQPQRERGGYAERYSTVGFILETTSGCHTPTLTLNRNICFERVITLHGRSEVSLAASTPRRLQLRTVAGNANKLCGRCSRYYRHDTCHAFRGYSRDRVIAVLRPGLLGRRKKNLLWYCGATVFWHWPGTLS